MKKITLLLITISLYFSAFATIDTLNVNISNDTIISGDTIYVSQGIVIDSGFTMTVSPGIVFIFKGDTAFNNMQNTNAGYLYVKGNINAAGLFDNRITFTRADTLNWGGILFHNNADSSLLKYCDISYANGIDSLENFNYKGAVSVRNNKLKVFSCLFENNDSSAIHLDNADINLFNNIIVNNNIAITADTSDFFMGNNTITDNTYSLICSNNSTPTIVNSIVYGNTNLPVWTNATITYSDVEDGFTGTGNLNIDPEFTTIYKVSPCSGVINLGSADANMLLEDKDYFGNDRVYNVVVDMGAFENQYNHSYYSYADTSVFNICGDSVEINGTWYSNDTTFTTIYTPAVNYCDSTVNIKVQQFTFPTIVFSVTDTTVCLGGQFPLFASLSTPYPSATYLWTNNIDTIVDTDTTVQIEMDYRTKEYYLTVDIDGCVLSDTPSVSVFDEYVIDLGPDSTNVCRGHVIDAGAGQTSYEWSTGETTSAITILNTGQYSVAVTDTNNCIYRDTIYVPILPSPVVDFEDDTVKIYTDGTTILGGVALGYDNYLWNTGAITPYITVKGDIGIGNHEYWLYCSFTNGCEDSDTIIVKVLDGVNVEELNTINGINIYPNPSNGIFNITGEFNSSSNIIITVSDITGKVVLNKELNNVSILNQEIDLKNNNKGIYFIKINNDEKVATYKVTIK